MKWFLENAAHVTTYCEDTLGSNYYCHYNGPYDNYTYHSFWAHDTRGGKDRYFALQGVYAPNKTSALIYENVFFDLGLIPYNQTTTNCQVREAEDLIGTICYAPESQPLPISNPTYVANCVTAKFSISAMPLYHMKQDQEPPCVNPSMSHNRHRLLTHIPKRNPNELKNLDTTHLTRKLN